MNSRVFSLFAGVVILFGAYKMLSPDYGAEAKTRVTNVLRGMQAGTGTVAGSATWARRGAAWAVVLLLVVVPRAPSVKPSAPVGS